MADCATDVRAAAWVHDARPLRLNGESATLRASPLCPCKKVHLVPAGHQGRVFDLAFASGIACPVLASASDDNTVQLWNADAPDQSTAMGPIGCCKGHRDSVLRVNWNKDSTLIASGDSCVSELVNLLYAQFLRRLGLQVLLIPLCNCGRFLICIQRMHHLLLKSIVSEHCRCMEC